MVLQKPEESMLFSLHIKQKEKTKTKENEKNEEGFAQGEVNRVTYNKTKGPIHP